MSLFVSVKESVCRFVSSLAVLLKPIYQFLLKHAQILSVWIFISHSLPLMTALKKRLTQIPPFRVKK